MMSGSISTATSSASGASGTPIALAIGPTEITKLIVPGSETELSDTRKATNTPAISAADLEVRDIIGLTYNPLTRRYKLEADVEVNYMIQTLKEA